MGSFNKELNLEFFQKIDLIRKAEAAIIKSYPKDEMKTPMHMSFGQEASPVGICRALKKSDKVLSSYRTHGLYLAKTGETDLFFSEMFGKRSGIAMGKSGSMHLTSQEHGFVYSSAIVASQIPVALGVAFASKRLGQGYRTAVFFGDGAIEEGSFWETLNAACLMRVPLLFVFENNGIAVHTAPGDRQGFSDVRRIVSGFDCFLHPETPVDVADVYDATTECLSRMSSESRPAFLEVQCYRHLEHVGVNYDFKDNYRSKAEYEKWLALDPYVTQRKKILENGVSEPEIATIEKKNAEQVERSIEIARKAPAPGPEELHRGLFG